PPNSGYQSAVLRGSCQLTPHNARNNVILQNVPCCLPGFIAVKRAFGGGHLAPTGMRSVGYVHQNNVTFLCPAETGLERIEQLHLQLAYFNATDEHVKLPG